MKRDDKFARACKSMLSLIEDLWPGCIAFVTYADDGATVKFELRVDYKKGAPYGK